jgi:hypothetical protein
VLIYLCPSSGDHLIFLVRFSPFNLIFVKNKIIGFGHIWRMGEERIPNRMLDLKMKGRMWDR